MNRDHLQSPVSAQSSVLRILALIGVSLTATWFAGCSHRANQPFFAPLGEGPLCDTQLQHIEYPDLADDIVEDDSDAYSPVPMTISTFQDQAPWELTLEQCVEYALANSEVMQKLGGRVVSAPAGTTTLYDQAIQETGQGSVENALSAFDAQVATSFFYNRNERKFNNPIFGGGSSTQISNTSAYRFELAKQTAAGTSFALRNIIDYNRNNAQLATDDSPFGNRFGSVYDWVNQVEVRQPLMRGRGTAINRIAGPNAVPGQYNGVLIARIRSDISLADFEAAVRDLVRDVESNYWELYFAYRDLDTKLGARASARETWDNRRLRYENGVGRPDEEAQARQQYFSFHAQAQNALSGVLNGQLGVMGAERNLRRLMGVRGDNQQLIRPISEPAIAPVVFNWDESQYQALERRVEVRRQKWSVRQRELELLAAKSLNKWRFDLVGQYGFRGFGDDLFGSRSISEGSAFDDLINGDLDDWQLGLEFGGAIGNRQGHLAIRSAELNLVREKSLLKEQKRQIIHDLNAAYVEVDRAMEALKTSYNSRIAVQEELDPKRKRVTEGQDQVFFLLDAEQRAATAESNVHRAVADYNQALLNYAYTSSSLLSRYNVTLTEGPWSGKAQRNASRKSGRFRQIDTQTCRDVNPVSAGKYNQASNQNAATGTQNYNSVPYQTYENEAIEGDVVPADADYDQDGDGSEASDLLEDVLEGTNEPSLESPDSSRFQLKRGMFSKARTRFSRR